MSGHVTDCKRPSFWKRRFVHRPWICDECGQAWVARRECMTEQHGRCVYLWERWPAPGKSWGLQPPEVDDS